MAAHAAGIDRETFIEWSIGDPLYANEAEEIGRRWDSLKPDGGITARVLFVEARLAELDRYLQTGLGALPWQVPFRAGTTFEPTQNLKLRVNGILRMVERARGDGREPALYRAACVIREIIAEGRLEPKTALSLLESACRVNRLWTEAPRVCRRTIVWLSHCRVQVEGGMTMARAERWHKRSESSRLALNAPPQPGRNKILPDHAAMTTEFRRLPTPGTYRSRGGVTF
jgi:Primase C terminal 2 (PriCT-2)